ncbi:hypothetical protein [Burkholderia vietnamiensis]|uniref:hypothetical protein n=1 Tax=Burkholderia vietnamiensis TaxID=60552 RepID=UPI002012E4DC|nr:hypothetical protein [Burkholderia vietnamiensis]
MHRNERRFDSLSGKFDVVSPETSAVGPLISISLGCSRGQAIGGAFDLQEQGLAKDIESTKSQSGEYFLVPIDERCEAARLYRTKLEKLSRQQGLSDAFDKTLPALQAIFLEALSAMEGKHINQSSS